ncbi:hypothetical protein MRB53_034917 [Persea americana]|uniref:Uncharacterized protein n=1 Tax=Persea americana TaxID=3435 RepID=A0ACC2K374_PERAE|nr:hypothetical protein MRB53_034917 [Persea americana]
MASHLPLLLLLSLSFLSGADRILKPSDADALREVMEDLGVNGQPSCLLPGISCETRVSRNSSEIRVTRIVFRSQRLNGFLSPVIGRLSELKELSLPNNHLFDEIPPQIGNCKRIQVLNLRGNRFFGEIPDEFSSLTDLRILDLSSNQFSGDLGFLKNFRKIENLSVSDNLFIGEVPSFLRSFRNLKFLNLTANRLQSTQPHIEISSPRSNNVRLFPRRYRFAEGNSTSKSNSTQNHTSAHAPSATPSRNSSQSSSQAPAPSQTKRHHRKRTKSLVLGFIVGAIAGMLSGLVFSLLFRFLLNCMQGRGKTVGPDIFSPMIKRSEDLAFLEKEDGLSSLEIIGRGGCGEVYKAELPGSNGKLIAIKKIIQPTITEGGSDLNEEDSKLLNKRMRQIRSEIQTVGHIRHRNLLPLLAHVARPDCHYLVYEYMKNGSLQDVLRQVSDGTRELDWPARHKIAMGIAAGLEYLHLSHSPRIIHRDLKPANILLDDDMEARIADFGLAKPMPDTNTHVTTSNVAGTVGFIAPEYHQTLKFTDKCDIYSFGVVLVTLVMGKLPSDEFFQTTEEMSLVKWTRNVMASGNPNRAIDPKLLGQGFDEQMVLVLKIACFCTLDEAKQRPNSKDVRCMLSQLLRNPGA